MMMTLMMRGKEKMDDKFFIEDMEIRKTIEGRFYINIIKKASFNLSLDFDLMLAQPNEHIDSDDENLYIEIYDLKYNLSRQFPVSSKLNNQELFKTVINIMRDSYGMKE